MAVPMFFRVLLAVVKERLPKTNAEIGRSCPLESPTRPPDLMALRAFPTVDIRPRVTGVARLGFG